MTERKWTVVEDWHTRSARYGKACLVDDLGNVADAVLIEEGSERVLVQRASNRIFKIEADARHLEDQIEARRELEAELEVAQEALADARRGLGAIIEFYFEDDDD